jgi:hypothetical protein
MVLAQRLNLSRYVRIALWSAIATGFMLQFSDAGAQTRTRRAADNRGPETCASTSEATLDKLTPENELLLSDGRLIRLAGVVLTGKPPDLAPGARLSLTIIGEADRWNRLPALVARTGQSQTLQHDLLSNRRALVRPEPGLGGCLVLLQQAEATSPLPFPALPRDAGRFARLEGRVIRLREGRSAWFISLPDGEGRTAAAMVQKRDLQRFKLAGRDIATLANMRIRVRGTRHVRNPELIPLTHPDEIEIIRQ